MNFRKTTLLLLVCIILLYSIQHNLLAKKRTSIPTVNKQQDPRADRTTFSRQTQENMRPSSVSLTGEENTLSITQTNDLLTLPKQKSPQYMQGLYFTAYFMKSSKLDETLQKAKIAGINTIIFDVKEMQGSVYFSIVPHPELTLTTAEPILDLNQTIEKIHAYGFYCVARIVQFYNISCARKHPELQPKQINGGYWQEKPEQPAWLDPSHPMVQSELLKIIEIVAKSNVDEIQLDYVRFPTEGKLSEAIFYFQTEDQARKRDDPEYIPREKREIIRDYVKEVKKITNKHHVGLSADIFAIVAWQRTPDIKNTGQDIAYLSPYLDRLHPMIYSSHFSDDFIFENDHNFINRPYRIIKSCITKTRDSATVNCQIIPYLQAFGWRVDYTKTYMYDQLQAAANSKSRGYILWNGVNSYQKALSWIEQWNIENQNQNLVVVDHQEEIKKSID